MSLLVKRLDTLMSKRKLKYTKSNLTKCALKNKLCELVNPHKSRTKWMDCQCDSILCERQYRFNQCLSTMNLKVNLFLFLFKGILFVF